MDDLNIQAGVTVNAEQAERAFTNLGDKAQKMANEVTKAADKAGKATDGMGDGAEKSAEKFTRAESRMRTAIQKSTRELEMLGKTASQKFEAQLEFKGLDKAKFQPFLDELRKAEEATKRAESGLSGLGSAAQAAGRAMAVAFSGAAAFGVVGKLVEVQREFDVLNSSLKTVTGSSAAAEREMAWLKDFAKETPFGLAQATQGFVKMKALGLDPTRAALTSFGNTASAMGKDLNQMIEAVADASTGEFERLKEFGIKAKKEGDNVSLTFQGVTKTIGNSAREITQYLEDIGNTSFGGAMEERAKTLDGTIAALGDTWDELFRTVSTNNVGGLIFDSVTLANGVLEDATTIIRAMGGAVGETSREFGSLSAIQGGVATFFETVSVLAANTLYVLRQTGDTMAGVAAGYKAFFSFDFDAVRAIGAEMKANGEAARKEIDATTARILNARKAQEEYARYATRNASAATDPRRIDLGGSAPRATGGVSSGTAKAVKETISEYDKLIKKLSDELPKAAAEAEAAQMGYNKAQTEFLALAGSPAWASFSNSQRAVVASMFEGKIASEEAGEAAKALSKSYAEAAAERIKTIQSMERAADSLQSQNDALREEIELIGLSTEQQTLVLQQRNDVIILTKEATLAELERQSAITGTQTRVEIALASEIDALKERNALLGAKGVKSAAVDAAKSAADEWQKTSDKINDTLTDALMRGFESGKDFAKNLRDTVVNMFKTMVLRPVISAIVNPVAGAVTGMMGLPGTANAATATSGVDVVGAISNGMSMLNTGISSAVQGTFSKFALSETGKSLGLSMAGPDASGYNMLSGTGQQMSQALGVVGDTLAGYAMGSMARSLISNGYSAGKGMDNFQKAGIAVGSAIGGPVAGAIIGAGAGVFNQLFGRKLKDSGIQGTFGGTAGFDGEKYEFYKGGILRSDKTKTSPLDQGTTDGLTQQFRAIQLSTGLMAETLGLASGAVASFTKDIKLSFKGLTEEQIQEKMAAEFTAISDEMAGQVLGTMQTVTETISTGLFKKPVTRVTYVQSEYAKANETASQTLTRLSTSLITVNSAFELLGVAMLDASLASGDMASRLMEQSGGGEAFAANLGTYYDNFYDQAEKTAYVTGQVTAALASVGLQMPKTREEFRALVESQIALGDSGTQAVAALLGVSGAFASVTDAAETAAAAATRVDKAKGADRKDRLNAERAAEKERAEALQKQIEAYAEGAEQFNTLRDSLLKAGDAAGLLAAATERAFADPSGKYMNGRYDLPRWESTDTAASFNYRYGEMQARMRQQLGDEASANALRIENVKGVLGAYSVESMMSEYDTVTGPIKIAIQQAIVDASGDLGFAVRDAVQGAALYAAMADVRGQFTSSGPGLASIAAARARAADASRTSIDPATGLYRIGGAAVEYGKALESLQGYMRSGAIDADTFERAVEALGAALPGAAESLGTLEDVIAAVERASFDVGTAGLNSIRYYFGSLSDLTAEFAKAAAEAQEPIAQTTAAIGRLNSAQSAFGDSAAAALEGFGGGGLGGAQVLQNTAVMKDITRAKLIAEAAGIASAAMTTADAAAAAVKLAQSPAFAELGAKGIRDAALLLDGVGEYNAEGFERAFIRISDALAKGNVDEGQYKALFDTALDMFEGVPEETRTLIDSMTRLRDAMSGFADGLLIDEQRTTLSAGATLAEMQRQYAQAFAGAATGDNDAIGKYQQLANTLLDKDLYSTQAEYNAAFGSVYGDARQLEAIGINTMANAQGNEMVSELKDMNAKLNKRVEDLEKNLLAALAQIAKNTSDTSRGIEQQIVMAEDTP